MTKGTNTREEILNHAVSLASSIGLEGLTIGRLATDLDLSKSGLFAHFQSKESLQIQVLDAAAQRFAEMVVLPALAKKAGLERIRAVFENWMQWGRANFQTGGCIFVAVAAEFDDRPGPVRDHLVAMQKKWITKLGDLADEAMEEGAFRKNTAREQFAQDLFGIMLSCHYFARLLRDRHAEKKARLAFENLLSANLR